MRPVAPQHGPDQPAAQRVRLPDRDHRVPAPRLQLVAPEVRRLVHLRELDQPVDAGNQAVVLPAPVDAQRRVLADEDTRIASRGTPAPASSATAASAAGGEGRIP